MAEFKVEHKKQQSSEHGTVSQRKGETVLPDNRGQVSQARVLTDNRTAQLASDITAKPNNTGLPNQLKAGIESLSGMSMDHVKVHYNSSQPAQLNAHAYAQGSNIHLAPGQEKHLPHEAWHVVQQAQGRVKPTMQMKTGVPVNDDAGLEREADVMGVRAMRDTSDSNVNKLPSSGKYIPSMEGAPIQRLSFNGALARTGVTAPPNIKETVGAGRLVLAGGVPGGVNGKADLVEAQNIPEKKGRIQALAEAARDFSLVGNAVREIQASAAAPTPLVWVWARGQTPAVLEPFIYKIVVPYGKSKSIELQYQVAPGLFGYVVRQKDLDDSQVSEISTAGPQEPTKSGHSATFNMAHHDTKNTALSSLLEQNPKASRAENEVRLDARTKLAGEGARWNLVLHNMHRISNSSKIWTRVPKNKMIRYVTFDTLWVNWAAVFSNQFGIEDAEVAKALRNNSTPWNGTVHEIKREQFTPGSSDIEVN
jgi:hypothetical protein